MAVTDVSLNKASIALTVGNSETLVATVTPDNATNKTVTWASSNTAVATVDENGKVVAVGVGSATITVTTVDGGKTATCTVSVTRSGGSGGSGGGGGFISSVSTCYGGYSCPVRKFSDTDPKAWYHDGIHYCVEKGLMQGYEDKTFRPNTELNRGHIVTILWRQAGSPKVTEKSTFSDVPETMYCAEAVAWAEKNGIALGYEDGTFKPTQPVSRQQLATFLWRYAKVSGVNVSQVKGELHYVDSDKVADYAKQALVWAARTGVMEGYEDVTIRPTNTATRAHAAAMLQRYCQKVLGKR